MDRQPTQGGSGSGSNPGSSPGPQSNSSNNNAANIKYHRQIVSLNTAFDQQVQMAARNRLLHESFRSGTIPDQLRRNLQNAQATAGPASVAPLPSLASGPVQGHGGVVPQGQIAQLNHAVANGRSAQLGLNSRPVQAAVSMPAVPRVPAQGIGAAQHPNGNNMNNNPNGNNMNNNRPAQGTVSMPVVPCAPAQSIGAAQNNSPINPNGNNTNNNRPAATGMAATAPVHAQSNATKTWPGPNTTALLLRMDARLGFLVENITLHRQQVNILAGEVRNGLGQLSVLQQVLDKLTELEKAVNQLDWQQQQQQHYQGNTPSEAINASEADADADAETDAEADASDSNEEEL